MKEAGNLTGEMGTGSPKPGSFVRHVEAANVFTALPNCKSSHLRNLQF
jgi:hypothetical protein